MPIHGVDIEPKTLELIDLDSDGRIRVHDVLAAITWIKETFKKPDEVLTTNDSVKLAQIADAKVLTAAKHMLEDLGKPSVTARRRPIRSSRPRQLRRRSDPTGQGASGPCAA